MILDPQTKKKLILLINNAFMLYDFLLAFISLLLTFVLITDQCASLSSLIYFVFFTSQSFQHYLIWKFPLIDINKHYVAYRRIVIGLGVVDAGYMFMCVTFWQKTEVHPVYCAICKEEGFGQWVGIILIFHLVFIIGWFITLVQGYVTRRYYLLALGGFEVEQRIKAERERQLHEVMIFEPDDNPYSFSQNKNKDKYYHFEDVVEVDETKYECSICLNKAIDEDHFVDAGCGHFYHQVCLIQWAQVNSKCPQCRHEFEEVTTGNNEALGEKEKNLASIEETAEEQEEALDEIGKEENRSENNYQKEVLTQESSNISTIPSFPNS